jgi:hypothetical protein
MSRLVAGAGAVAMLVLSVPAAAQQRPEPAGPGTIVGVVVDPLGNPLEGADVYIVELQKHRTVGADGRFRFDSIPDGEYIIAARHVGFLGSGRKVTMTPEGLVAAFRLQRITRNLPAIVTSAPRGGLSGVIGDTAYKVIVGAEIETIGATRRAKSDSSGMFYIKVPTGRHMVSVKAPGYTTKLVAVTVPKDSGRQILVQLSPSNGRNENRLESNLEELHQRLMRRSAAYSAVYTREDINKSGPLELIDLARRGAQYAVRDDCTALIDGGPMRVPLYALSTADVEMVEVYQARRPRYTSSNLRSSGGRLSSARPPECATVYVWLRK